MNINLNFEKPTISTGIVQLLMNNMTSVIGKESLKIIVKGNKLQYGPANSLLSNLLKAMNLEDTSPEDEITHNGTTQDNIQTDNTR